MVDFNISKLFHFSVLLAVFLGVLTLFKSYHFSLLFARFLTVTGYLFPCCLRLLFVLLSGGGSEGVPASLSVSARSGRGGWFSYWANYPFCPILPKLPKPPRHPLGAVLRSAVRPPPESGILSHFENARFF